MKKYIYDHSGIAKVFGKLMNQLDDFEVGMLKFNLEQSRSKVPLASLFSGSEIAKVCQKVSVNPVRARQRLSYRVEC